jgi:hypothetical protein
MVYQFTSHKNLPKGSACPIDRMFQLYGKALKKKKLSREEKDYVANRLYGISGCGSSLYKTMGFQANFFQVFPRILVNIKYYGWQTYYAPDKTSLRKAIPEQIIEMIYAPEKNN